MHKCIFQGKLSFKSISSLNKAREQYENRAEVFFKDEVVFKAEEIFDEEDLAINVTRKVTNIPTKFWKNTLDLFDYIRQFALGGEIECWMVESGQILEYERYEPKGDKAVILNYQAGKSLADQEGKEEEALAKLTRVIDKYERHSQAYERRGMVNFKLKSYEDARYDFDKSIRLDGQNANAYYGRGILNMVEKKWQAAHDDFEMAGKRSLAVEPLFWMARRKKAAALLEMESWELAVKDLKLLVKRKFDQDDPNFKHIPEIHTMYVKALINKGEVHEALEFIESNLNDSNLQTDSLRGSWMTDRGVVRKVLGEEDFKKDWEEAAALGEPRANRYLAEMN